MARLLSGRVWRGRAWHGRPLRGRRGVAAVEFALLAPIATGLVLTLYDVSAAIVAWWQVASAAQAVGLIATTEAATPSSTNVLTTQQAFTASTAIFGVMPSLKGKAASRYGVTLTSIVFMPTVAGCTSNCIYVANVAWSDTLQGTSQKRPCGAMAAAADAAPPSFTTVPADSFSAAPMLVVDVVYDYVPALTNLFGAGLWMHRAAYLGTRTGDNTQWTRYTGADAARVQCPGYTG